jgi:COMPASS component BRE2
VADPQFPHKQYYRQSEIPPFNARFSQEDSDRNIHFDPNTMCTITNEKGWRSSRANVFVREGSMYYEIKIQKGIRADEEPGSDAPQPHLRFGWARREAPLDAPIGFDAYSYGITDTKFDTMHRSRPGKLFTSKKSKTPKGADQGQLPIQTGDVVGLLITLPPLPLHRKVVAGTYNPAVDFSAIPDPTALPPDVIRDRIPVPYRGTMYFETIEYQPTKVIQTYTDRTAGGSEGAASGVARPHPNHDDPQLRTLPGSSIKVWKNGVPVGTAFENLLAFLPPASSQAGASHTSRQNLDDGQLGYYPFVSLFWGAVAEINLGPDLWFPPEDLDLGSHKQSGDVEMGEGEEAKDELGDVMKPRAVGERYKEQIAEDIVWDLVDEVTFHVQDGETAAVS